MKKLDHVGIEALRQLTLLLPRFEKATEAIYQIDVVVKREVLESQPDNLQAAMKQLAAEIKDRGVGCCAELPLGDKSAVGETRWLDPDSNLSLRTQFFETPLSCYRFSIGLA